MRQGTISYRLSMLRNRINEKKETNVHDISLLDESVEYILGLEKDIAVLYDEVNHPKKLAESSR